MNVGTMAREQMIDKARTLLNPEKVDGAEHAQELGEELAAQVLVFFGASREAD